MNLHLFTVYITTLPVTQDYNASNDYMINEWRTGRDVEGGGRGLIKVLP
jgi:hypothetical protein